MVAFSCGCEPKARVNSKDFSASNSVGIVFGEIEKEYGTGLDHISFERDGLTATNEVNDSPCRCLHLEEGDVGYFYFVIDSSFKSRSIRNVIIEAEYLDTTPGTLGIEYDASKSRKDARRAYTGLPHIVQLSGSKQWRTVAFQIEDATFRNAQNSHSDFRLWVKPPDLCIRRVTVTRGVMKRRI